MADYPSGYEIAKYLMNHEEIVGVVVRSPNDEANLNKGCSKKILDLLNLPKDKTFIWDKNNDLHERVGDIKKLKPDLILLAFCCGRILKPELINIPSSGCINIHLAYLPYNRGRNPNVWAIVDGTPAGVTIHYIDEGIDTGDIIAQTKIPVESIDTGKSIYQKIDVESVRLFKDIWPKIKDGTVERIKQNSDKGTFHYGKEFQRLDLIELDKKYTGRELINQIRSRTFRPHPASYFIDDNGRKVFLRLQLEYENKGNYD